MENNVKVPILKDAFSKNIVPVHERGLSILHRVLQSLRENDIQSQHRKFIIKPNTNETTQKIQLKLISNEVRKVSTLACMSFSKEEM